MAQYRSTVLAAYQGVADALHALAQDEDGRWFWYRNEPTPGFGGGVWRANSRNQQYAGQGQPNALWMESLRRRYY